MSFPSNAPRLLRGGIILLDPATSAVRRIIALQYNPDSISRSLQVQSSGTEAAQRSEAMRLKGPPIETIKLEAEMDATDQLEIANGVAVQVGLQPQLSVLELIIYPTSAQLMTSLAEAQSGRLEIAAMQAPLTAFVWSAQRVTPVRITELSITEEAFDTALNPMRAKVSLGLRVLNVNDVGHASKSGGLFMSYLRAKESLAQRATLGSLGALGIQGV